MREDDYSNNELLQTIKVPRDLTNLSNRLPKSNYVKKREDVRIKEMLQKNATVPSKDRHELETAIRESTHNQTQDTRGARDTPLEHLPPRHNAVMSRRNMRNDSTKNSNSIRHEPLGSRALDSNQSSVRGSQIKSLSRASPGYDRADMMSNLPTPLRDQVGE